MSTISAAPSSGFFPVAPTLTDALDDAPLSRFHLRAVIVSGAGFFTDAYDLFVISTVATLVATQWKLGTLEKSWVSGAAILGAFLGAATFGRIADRLGRKSVYVTVAIVMVVGALLSAVASNVAWLVAARFLLGLGIGGDYPVSAVLMSEYSNRNDRGRTVGLVFSMQALGLVVGPLVALGLLSSGIGDGLTWRLLLGLGAIPAATVLWLRTKMPESPRFVARVRGDAQAAAADMRGFSQGAVSAEGDVRGPEPAGGGLRQFLADRRMLRLLIGTAGSWLLFDYAYYGNTLSLPTILKDVSPTASISSQLLWTLAIFVVCAVPGYLLAVAFMDRIGHRRLQLIGFAVMAVTFLVLGLSSALTSHVGAFLPIFGLGYLFIEFGPNTTTFVLPSEVFPTRYRTTGHGVAAGIGKLGAFVGVFLVPVLVDAIGLRGMLVVAAAAACLGLGVTTLLPEPARRSLDEVSQELQATPGSSPHSARSEGRSDEAGSGYITAAR